MTLRRDEGDCCSMSLSEGSRLSTVIGRCPELVGMVMSKMSPQV